ncbi:hypothetical protein [Ferrimonas marina]|uniref:Uncharacterized protein n=1 Tax=Ferrimonas marina TaxID=299255 RepID=A0A1M5ZA75_9GAMM|nr:hypothetical protein [Ferrimonas marina]SHI21135.1 hypothetical protein SAMN02745129_0087 [Ferrimonas marina]
MKAWLLIGMSLLSLPLLAADEVEMHISEALEFYKEGNYGEAAASLQYATQLIQQKKGGALAELLPPPLSGWKINMDDETTTNTGMMGGIMVARDYEKGDARVEISLMTDSPMLQGVLMMLSNPSFASAQGSKMERIGRQKAMVTYDEQRRGGELNMVIDNRVLVQISGSNVDRQDLLDYAAALDVEAISEMP